jgi:hypothetical protein
MSNFDASKRIFKFISTESITTIFNVLQNAVRWFYHTKIARDIIEYKIEIPSSNEVAYLYLYNKKCLQDNNKIEEVLLFSHGDFSHAYTLLHLARVANALHIPTFLLNMPHDDLHHNETSQQLVEKALETIHTLVDKKDGVFKGIILAGHSKGAIWSAYHAFAKNDPRVTRVVSIAGRLKDIQSADFNERELLKPILVETLAAIQSKDRTKTLFQIVPGNDAVVPRESMMITDDHCYIIPNASHLGVLFHPQTLQLFKKILYEN